MKLNFSLELMSTGSNRCYKEQKGKKSLQAASKVSRWIFTIAPAEISFWSLFSLFLLHRKMFMSTYMRLCKREREREREREKRRRKKETETDQIHGKSKRIRVTNRRRKMRQEKQVTSRPAQLTCIYYTMLLYPCMLLLYCFT